MLYTFITNIIIIKCHPPKIGTLIFMPIYLYHCPTDGDMELEHSMTADKPECPICKGELTKKFYANPVIFTGTGFYSTDKKLRNM